MQQTINSNPNRKLTSLVLSVVVILLGTFSFVLVSAETVTGGGYIVEQTIAPLQGALTGNGYIAQQSTQVIGGQQSGGGYTVNGVFGASVQTTTSPSGGNGGGGGGGYYVIIPPNNGTGIVTVTTASGTTITYTVDEYRKLSLHGTTSTCKTRLTFTSPIDIGLDNNKEDVKKLETFLNSYENEKLPVNGIYEKRDVDAVKRWQQKYKTFILDPMLLKQPTGTVYTLSQRQIERQTTKTCGEPIIVTACPYFKEYASYGDRGKNVLKIQQFLNIVRSERLPLSGVYGPLTKAATKRFQQAYRKDIFNILKWSFISGNWNEATRVKANQAIGCDVVR